MSARRLGAPVPDWRPPPRPPADLALEGRWVRIEPLAPVHSPALHAANAADDAIWDHMPYGPFADASAHEAWLAGVAGKGDPFFLALVERATGLPGGVASLMRIAPEAGSIEIGHICLAPRLQRSRAASEALSLLIGWGFGAGYRRVEWKCDALNLASRRAAQRLGFSFEGVFRKAAVVKGRNRDTAWFAITDDEWPALAAAHARWLDPGNFDADGRQMMRLGELTAPARVAADPALGS